MDEPEANPYVRDPPLEFDPVEKLDEETVDAQVDHLREAIRYHDHHYYQAADPVVPDRTYDRLFDRLETLEDAFDLDSATSPTRRVGCEPLDELETVEHVTEMLSIDSAVEEREVREFDRRVRDRLADAGDDGPVEYLCEPKFDGLSVELALEGCRSPAGNGCRIPELDGRAPVRLRNSFNLRNSVRSVCRLRETTTGFYTCYDVDSSGSERETCRINVSGIVTRPFG
jgi:hypothetical protein